MKIYLLSDEITRAGPDVRYWHKADIPFAPHMSAFGGKADMGCCSANVRL